MTVPPSAMEESEFWSRLEFRVCRELELAALKDDRLRFLWCDGFIPEEYVLQAETPYIRGRAWIGRDRSGQEQWRFSLVLGHNALARQDMDWSALLPADDQTGWLAVDPALKVLRITPPARESRRRGGAGTVQGTSEAPWIYTVWFRDLDADPEDQDYEWVACIEICAPSAAAAREWGDHLAKRRVQEGSRDQFLWSDVTEPSDPMWADVDPAVDHVPIVRYGEEATDEYLGW